jgi:DNA-binding transcriptional MerR regulator
MREGLRVGELAQRAGVSAPALRFYERAGVLAPPGRTAAGYRLYPPEAVADVRFIAQAKALGLSLEQIRVLRAQPGAPVRDRELRHLLAHHLARIRQHRRDLDALEDALAGMFAAADTGLATAELPAAALAGEMARIEAAACRCGCALDPGCTCGCPCCSPDTGTVTAGAVPAGEGA